MTRFTIIVVYFFVIGLILTGQTYAKIDPKSVVGVWLFDEGSGNTAADASQNGHDGEIVGDVEWTKDGKFSTALSFPGIRDNIVSVPHSDALSLATFTVTAWINLEHKAFQTAVGKYREGGKDANYDVQVRSNGYVKMWVFCGGQGVQVMGGDVVVADSEWHHVAGVCNNATAQMYVDGILTGEAAIPAPPDTNDNPLTIGGSVINSYRGLIDDVGLFNAALTEDEIKSIMTKGLSEVLSLYAVFPAGKLTTTTWSAIKNH